MAMNFSKIRRLRDATLGVSVFLIAAFSESAVRAAETCPCYTAASISAMCDKPNGGVYWFDQRKLDVNGTARTFLVCGPGTSRDQRFRKESKFISVYYYGPRYFARTKRGHRDCTITRGWSASLEKQKTRMTKAQHKACLDLLIDAKSKLGKRVKLWGR